MGLLTIIRKNRQKEKEMRLLFLYVQKTNLEVIFQLTATAVLTMRGKQLSWRNLTGRILAALVQHSDLTSRHLFMESKVLLIQFLERNWPPNFKIYFKHMYAFSSWFPSCFLATPPLDAVHYTFRGRWRPDDSSTLLEKLFRKDGCFDLGGWFRRQDARGRLQKRAAQLTHRRCMEFTALLLLSITLITTSM